ncbi:hypothetical protein B0F90DRAFT_1622156 [Multifurca ochricompacta]|uniref:DNA replication factor Cdt1 C-terminal domain-containing protein n=1 Tax=Multifurca ochricompacta TaxID=376703 RepID=A0AAD4QSM9_9AGAM|nr:hypothetical protein B0F90DRAFT_1622156 [Multifurca ochricompacta]
MSDLYTSLLISPKKKRYLSDDEDDTTLTPKRLRIAPPSPPKTVKANRFKSASVTETVTDTPSLPSHLSRLFTIQTALHHALSHALASSAVSPSTETGILRNVLNHHSLNAYAGLTVKLNLDDLSRLCWLWEWKGDIVPPTIKLPQANDDDSNPFLEDSLTSQPKDWTRGSMGFVISPTSHFSKTSKTRIPAYGIGIEVEMDLDKDMGSGMASVARWTADGEKRRQIILSKLRRWAELHVNATQIPNLPMADLPQLIVPSKPSKLTQLLASASPKSPSSVKTLMTPPSPTSSTKASRPSTSSRSPVKGSSTLPNYNTSLRRTPARNSALALKSIAAGSIQFPKTPSRRAILDDLTGLLTPKTPSVSPFRLDPGDSLPSTPVHQRGSNAATVPQTPTSSRRQALYERIRQKSLTNTPTKALSKSKDISGGKLSRDQLLKLSQEEMRRRVLLGRLEGVAESVWMYVTVFLLVSMTNFLSRLFSGPSTTNVGLSTRKRRALPASEVAAAVLKSSTVPMSTAEAQESLTILASLCPFFLKLLDIDGQEWLEMPASAYTSSERLVPTSPAKDDSAEVVLIRSPRRVKKESGGLREVRERIRREIELQD